MNNVDEECLLEIAHVVTFERFVFTYKNPTGHWRLELSHKPHREVLKMIAVLHQQERMHNQVARARVRAVGSGRGRRGVRRARRKEGRDVARAVVGSLAPAATAPYGGVDVDVACRGDGSNVTKRPPASPRFWCVCVGLLTVRLVPPSAQAAGRNDTSQKGNWCNFRNETLNKEPFVLDEASLLEKLTTESRGMLEVQ